jgi:WD40 repeat protein
MYNGNVVTGSENGSVVIYDLQSRNVKQVLKGHQDAVLAVAAHDKLPLLASGGMMADKKVEFWVLRKKEGGADHMEVEIENPARDDDIGRSKKRKGGE